MKSQKVMLSRMIVISLVPLLIGWVYFSPRSSSSLRKDAVAAYQARQFDDAIGFAIEFLNRHPSDPEMLLLAGECFEIAERFEEAIDYFDRAAEQNANSSEALFRSGRIFMHQLGQPTEAEQRFRKALDLDRNHLESTRELALLLAVEARREEAVPLILNLFDVGHVENDFLVLLGWENGIIARPQILEMFRKFAPQDPGTRLAEAWYLEHSPTQPEPGRAIDLLSELVNEKPTFWAARHALVRVAWKERRFEIVSPHLQECFQNANVPADLWIVRGELAEQTGDRQGAARCFWEAFQQNPTNRTATHHLLHVASQLNLPEITNALHAHTVNLERLKSTRNLVLTKEHESLEPVRQLVEELLNVGRLWEAWGWSQVALTIDPQAEWALHQTQQLESRLENCSGLVNEQIFDESSLANFDVPGWEEFQSVGKTILPTHAEIPNLSLTDEALKVGIDFTYFNSPNPKELGQRMYEFSGGGVGVLDLDQDGWSDILLTQGSQWPVDEEDTSKLDRLYRNTANDHFIDVTSHSGITENRFSQGVAIGDVDQDGFDDVYVSNIGPNSLYLNNGDGTFSGSVMGYVDDSKWTTSSVIADLNGDAFPEIYAVNYVEGNDVFDQICKHADGRPRMCMPFHFPGSQNQLYLNLGDGNFANQTVESGIQENDGKGLGVVVADFSGDQVPDIFVANDTVANALFVNESTDDSGIAFQEYGLLAGIALNETGKAEGCMGVAAGDVDGDGRIDLFVTNFHQESNTLFCQKSPGSFQDRTDEFELTKPSLPMLGFGAQFLDVDLNGALDLIVTNGHIDDLTEYSRPFKMPTQVFYQTSQKRFTEVSAERLGTFFLRQGLGRSMALLDWNRDGKHDVAISYLDGQFALVTNRTPETGHSLSLRLVTVNSSRHPIGAVVTVQSGSKLAVQQVNAGSGYQASNEKTLVFGLGEHITADQVEVRWPSGETTTFLDLKADREYLLRENSDVPLTLPK